MLKIINGEIVNYKDGIEMELVSALPVVDIDTNKLYILSSDYSLNYYDTSWHDLTSSGSSQIVIGTTNTDTTKLWLDITSTTSPILKWYNGTSWINVSGSSINSNVNKIISISTSDWVLDNSTNTYKTTIIHNLNTKCIIPTMYDSDEQINLLGITRIDNNTIQLENDIAINGELILNYSSSLINTRWGGKILNCLGDSITYGLHTTKIYHQYLKEIMNLGTVNNYGVSNSTITYANEANSIAMSIRYTTMSNEADIILVFAGTNDYGYNKPLGTNTDTTNTTFFGALKVLIEGLTTKYPTKTIVFVTPLQRNFTGVSQPSGTGVNELGFLLSQYVDAIVNMCNKYSIPVLDLYKTSGINLININTFTEDGLHPIAIGHERIAYKMDSFINAQ